MRPDSRLRELALYPHRVEVTARFSDLDPQRHLNNARLTEFYQEARLSFYHRLRATHGYQRDRGSRIMVAHHAIDYLGEVAYPGTVLMAAGVAHIGRTSHTLATAMFTQDRCVGLSKAVLVYTVDSAATEIPAEFRALLEKYLLPVDVRESMGT